MWRASANGSSAASIDVRAGVCQRDKKNPGDFQTSSACWLCRGGIGRRDMDGFLDCFNDFACNLCDLPHQVSAERKHNICQTRDVGQKGVSVFLNEAAIAQECLDPCPLVLSSYLRAHLKARRITRRTAKWVLAKNAGSAEHSDALGGAPPPMVGFLGAHVVRDEAGPLALPEVFETMRTADFNTDDFGHAAVVAEEVLGPRGGDVTTRAGGVEGGDTWPFLNGVDQRGITLEKGPSEGDHSGLPNDTDAHFGGEGCDC